MRDAADLIIAIMMVPIVAILALVGAGVIKMILGHLERKARIRADALAARNDSWHNDFEALRQELMRLRDTSTQYDISLQHTLEELRRRVEFLEARGRTGSPAAPTVGAEQETATIANRAG